MLSATLPHFHSLQPTFPASLPASLAAVGHACCDFDPEMRPEFSMVVEELSAALNEMRQQVGGWTEDLGLCVGRDACLRDCLTVAA
jgi:hypothetical protein